MAMYGPNDPYGQPGQNPPPHPQHGQPDNLGQTPYDPNQYPPPDQQGYPDQYSGPPNYDPSSAPPVFDAHQPPPGGMPPYGPPGGPPGGPPPPYGPGGPQGPPPKKGNGLMWGLIAGGGALVLVVLVVVVVGVFLISDDGDTTTTAEESQTATKSEGPSDDESSSLGTDGPSESNSSDPFAGYAEDDPIRGDIGDCVYAWSTGSSNEYDAKLVDCSDSTANAKFYDKATGTLDETKCPDHSGGAVEFWYWVDMPSGTSDDYVLCGQWISEPG